ncbi:MAG TPA: FHA domain-containing protein [Chthonomonadales bacterium]|nr:FHA domain-containing protein [Chthonomonadales bacterium]
MTGSRMASVLAVAIGLATAPVWAQAPAERAPGTDAQGVPQGAGRPAATSPPPAGGVRAPSAARVLKVTAPAGGEYTVTVLPSADARSQVQLPVTLSGAEGSVSYDPSAVGRSPLLAVDDARTGLSAVVPLPNADALNLHPLQFDRARSVEVRVTYEGRPLRAAVVTLGTGEQARTELTELIDETDRGVARFDRVALGKARLRVAYGSDLTDSRDIEVKPPSGGGPVTVPVAVSSAAPTLDEAAPAPAAGGELIVPPAGAPAAPVAPQAPGAGGGLVAILGQVLGVALVGGLAYGLYRWFQSGGMAATLKRAGIEVSGPRPPADAGAPWAPNAPPPPVVVEAGACQYCGQQKGPTGECACTVGAGSGAAAPGAPATPQPRMVGTIGTYAASIFSLAADGEVLIGRDPGNAVALPEDATVSRRHASVRCEAGGFAVTDLGSANGVFVNGVRIAGSQPLRPGDEVQIGSTRFRFEA